MRGVALLALAVGSWCLIVSAAFALVVVVVVTTLRLLAVPL